MEFSGEKFEFLRASDLDRDGMALEAYSPSYETGEFVAEVFYCDTTGKTTFTSNKPELPIELVRYMITEGLEQIKPQNSQ